MLKAIIIGKKETNNQCFQIFQDNKMVAICYGKILVSEVKNETLNHKFNLTAETKDGYSSFGYVEEILDMRG